MNQFISAIASLDISKVKDLIAQPKWRAWAEPSGKNALHFLCGVNTSGDAEKSETALNILKLLLKNGMDINSVHEIPDERCAFPATPLWYAYTRGRNEKAYKYLLKQGADPDNCWWAIAWYNDVPAGKLWLKHGAQIDHVIDDLFVGSFQWKRYEFADWLLDQGADVNTFGPDGRSALMIAVKRRDENAIKRLLKTGADPDLKNADGVSARSLAEKSGPKRLLQLFT